MRRHSSDTFILRYRENRLAELSNDALKLSATERWENEGGKVEPLKVEPEPLPRSLHSSFRLSNYPKIASGF